MREFHTLIGAVGFLNQVNAVGICCVLVIIPRGRKLRLHKVTLAPLDCNEWSVVSSELA